MQMSRAQYIEWLCETAKARNEKGDYKKYFARKLKDDPGSTRQDLQDPEFWKDVDRGYKAKDEK